MVGFVDGGFRYGALVAKSNVIDSVSTVVDD